MTPVGVAPIAGEVAVFLAGGHALALRSDEGLEMLRFDIELVRTEGYSLISPIVLPNLPEGCTLRKCNINSVKAGVDVIMIVECGDEMWGGSSWLDRELLPCYNGGG